MSSESRHLRSFASDNTAGAHPEVIDAVIAANRGHAAAYGGDELTRRVERHFERIFGEGARSYLVFGGTAANVLGLGALIRPHEAVICAAGAHINVDECGAPERFLGCKLIDVAAPDGKLTVHAIAERLTGIGVEHHVQPRVVALTQATEYGTVYSVEELQRIAGFARAKGLLVHMDGARLANAAAHLEVPLRAITRDIGVDVLSFGGTKNGLLGAEAVVFFDAARAATFAFARKQGMQLASKMRFLAAQFDALLGGDLWLRSAAHANAMARRLADRVSTVPGVTLTQPVQANAVFATVPAEHLAALQGVAHFYVWNDALTEVRWMTSFDTTVEEVDAFAGDVARIVGGAGRLVPS